MKYLFVELKTTGLDPSLHALIELCAIVQIDGIRESEIYFKARPLPFHHIDNTALKLSHLGEQEILNFPDGNIGLNDFVLFLKDFLVVHNPEDRFILVAYNAPFVMSFLESFFLDHSSQEFYHLFKSQPMDLLWLTQQYFAKQNKKPVNFKKSTVLDFFHFMTPLGIFKPVEEILSLFTKVFSSYSASIYIDLEDLNESQKQAVQYNTGALLVLAGAGSGKTRVITYKIAYLISQLGYAPSSILAVTFTNKAAKEMKERIVGLVGKGAVKDLTISTFHSLGLQILKQEYTHLNYTEEFSIFGDSEKEALLKETLLELRYSEEEYAINFLSSFISSKKNLLQKPHEIAEDHTPLQDIYKLYQDKLKLNNAFDFDDLIFQPLCLFFEWEDIKNKWSKTYQYILIDEYQDTNYSQYQLMKILSLGYGNICAVGDDDQSIYAFRGADIGHILSFEKDFKGAKRIVLNYNYRNTPVILQTATALIEHNPGRHTKEVLSGRKVEQTDKVFLYEAYDTEDEAQWIASEIFTNRIDRGVPYNDQAILCRTNAQMRTIEKVLRQENIRYHIIGGFSFFDRAEVKIIFSYLRLLYNSQDNQAFYKVVNFPKRGIGEKTLDILTQYAQAHQISLLKACSISSSITGLSATQVHTLEQLSNTYWDIYNKLEEEPLSQVIQEMYTAFGLQEEIQRVYKEDASHRIHSFIDIQSDIFKKERRYRFQQKEGLYPLSLYLQETILSQLKEEEVKEEEQKVLLITIHSAKGLEFKAVFIPGFQEGIFPHERSVKEGDLAIQEERRLAYVAFTRAQDFLFLSYTQYRKIQGEDREQRPSRFLEEIPTELLEKVEIENTNTVNEEKYLEEMRKILQIED